MCCQPAHRIDTISNHLHVYMLCQAVWFSGGNYLPSTCRQVRTPRGPPRTGSLQWSRGVQWARGGVPAGSAGGTRGRQVRRADRGAGSHPPASRVAARGLRHSRTVQQALARQLRTPPSRLVALVDDLDERGVLERRRNLEDRRLYALYVTDAGAALLRKIGQVARAHDEAVCASLDPAERTQLRALLARIAEEQGLTPGVHPGYRSI